MGCSSGREKEKDPENMEEVAQILEKEENFIHESMILENDSSNLQEVFDLIKEMSLILIDKENKKEYVDTAKNILDIYYKLKDSGYKEASLLSQMKNSVHTLSEICSKEK